MAVQLICNENDVISIDDMSNNGGGVLAALVAFSLKHHFANFVVQNTAVWLSIIASNIGKCLHKSTHFNYLYITCYKYYFLFNISYSPIPLYFCKYVFNSYHPYHTRVRQENTSQVHICIYTYIYIYIYMHIYKHNYMVNLKGKSTWPKRWHFSVAELLIDDHCHKSTAWFVIWHAVIRLRFK